MSFVALAFSRLAGANFSKADSSPKDELSLYLYISRIDLYESQDISLPAGISIFIVNSGG